MKNKPLFYILIAGLTCLYCSNTQAQSIITNDINVKGEFSFSENYPYIRTIRGRSGTTGIQNKGVEIYSSYDGNDGSALILNSNKASSPGMSELWSSGHDKDTAFRILNHPSANSYIPLMIVENNGKVTIGNDVQNNTTYNYKLYVQDGILTEKLRIANRKDFINWADFVFEKNYALLPLVTLEKYINKHKHLPDIPTTKEVNRQGIDVAEMQARLLQKIEELTLYIIQQQKEIDALKKTLHK